MTLRSPDLRIAARRCFRWAGWLGIAALLLLPACARGPSGPDRELAFADAGLMRPSPDLVMGWRVDDDAAEATVWLALESVRDVEPIEQRVAIRMPRGASVGTDGVALLERGESVDTAGGHRVAFGVEPPQYRALRTWFDADWNEAPDGSLPLERMQSKFDALAALLGVEPDRESPLFAQSLSIFVRATARHGGLDALPRPEDTPVLINVGSRPASFWGGLFGATSRPAPDDSDAIPSFRWPPPPPSKRMTLERSLVGLDRPTTLRAVADTLRSALQCQLPGKDLPGYSQMAFYSIPASSCRHSPRPADAPAVGFVLFTDIERIDADSARRVGWGLASPGLTDVIRWFAGGGEHYRVLGFAATPCEIDVASSEVRAWTRSLARSVVLHGDSGIDSLFDLDPDQPAPRALRVEMLLYEFEMPFSLISETQPATHFEASGLRQSFDPASSCRRDHATRADR